MFSPLYASQNLYYVSFIKEATFTHVHNFVHFPYISPNNTHLIITAHLKKPPPLLLKPLSNCGFPRSEKG